jgi:hypothetical protein
MSSGATHFRYERGNARSTVRKLVTMRKKRKPARPGRPPRNPFAKVLGGGLFKPKVVKRKDAYRRKPRHAKRAARDPEVGEE